MPHIAARLGSALHLVHIGRTHLPEDALGGSDLIGAHDEQMIRHIKHGVAQEDLEEGVLLKEGGSEILQILDGRVVLQCPVHGEVEGVFVALGGVGKIARVGAVGDDKDL